MKKFFKIIFGMIFILFLIVAVSVFVFIKTFDLNKYKTHISEIVYEQTGRNLALNGHAGIKISLIPTIELNDITFSNAPWAKNSNMIEVKNIDVAFSILPLFEKKIVIDKIHLNEPKVYLTVNEKGENNWTFSKLVSEDKKVSESKENNEVSSSDVAQGALAVSVVAKSFKIENGMLLYQDLQTKSRHEVKIKKIMLNSDGMDDDINADVDIVYNNEEIKANIVAGSINSLLQNADVYPLKADIKAYGMGAKADGSLSNLFDALKYNFELNLTNPAGNFGAPSVKLVSKLAGDMKKADIDIASLNVAGNEISGTVKADISSKKPYVNAKFFSSMIDVNKFNQTKKASNSWSLLPTAYAANFVPATLIDLSALNMVNANISLDVKKLILNSVVFDNIKSDITVNNGNAVILVKELGVGDGKVSGSLNASASNNFAVDLAGKNIVLQKLIKDLVPSGKDLFGILSGGKTDLTIKLTSKGNDVRSITEAVNGQFIVVVGESKVQMGTLKYLQGSFVSQILSALKIKTSDKNLDVSCAVIRSDIVDGKANFPKGIAFKTNRFTIVSDGYVNLKNDKIDLSIKPFNGKISDTNVVQAISSMLKVGGTIQKPSLTIDNSSVIKNVVGVAAIGPAFLGSQLMFNVDEYPCYTALKGTSYEKMFPAPSGVKSAGQNIYQGANDVVSDGVNLVNDAANGVINFLKGNK